MDHMDSPEHAAERAALVAAVIAATSGVAEEARERLGTVVGRIFDIGCEFDLATMIAAIAVSRAGSRERLIDRLEISLEFPDAEPLREEAAREQHEYEIKQERSN